MDLESKPKIIQMHSHTWQVALLCVSIIPHLQIQKWSIRASICMNPCQLIFITGKVLHLLTSSVDINKILYCKWRLAHGINWYYPSSFNKNEHQKSILTDRIGIGRVVLKSSLQIWLTSQCHPLYKTLLLISIQCKSNRSNVKFSGELWP